VLALSLALGQFFTKVIAFQWIFGFVIAGVLFAATVFIAFPGAHRDTAPAASENERAPLLDDA
jgi:hypothetical protein